MTAFYSCLHFTQLNPLREVGDEPFCGKANPLEIQNKPDPHREQKWSQESQTWLKLIISQLDH